MILFQHEIKSQLKSLLIWAASVGGMCLGCILLYTSLEASLQDIADSYANMGAMSTALGMDKMSLATLTGFYATEIAMMHGLGGAMFASIVGSSMLSKEEACHTAEFLNTLPLSRTGILFSKYISMVSLVCLFNIICVILYLLGFWGMGEKIPQKEMAIYHLLQLLILVEVGTICFAISAYSRKNRLGAGLGLVIFLFAADMMCRIIPAIEKLKFITPFYYSNAVDIFTNPSVNWYMIGIGGEITALALILAWKKYNQKDLAV